MGLMQRLARPSRRRTRVALAVLAVSLLAVAADGWRWQRALALDAEAAALAAATERPVRELPNGAALPLRLARAQALSRAGELDRALEALRPLQGDDALGQAARFNSANILVRQAQALQAGATPGQAIPALELAKELYREVLRHDPGHWNARYNLERAQRLLPDPEPAADDGGEAPRARERAATTVRGVAQGMP
jgi:mxaK protein